MKKVIKIEKEQLKKINFSKSPILKSKLRKKLLKRRIDAAVQQRNDKDGKVEIVFKTEKRGFFKVSGAILMVGKEFIQLKGGYYMPLCSISNIKFRTA